MGLWGGWWGQAPPLEGKGRCTGGRQQPPVRNLPTPPFSLACPSPSFWSAKSGVFWGPPGRPRRGARRGGEDDGRGEGAEARNEQGRGPHGVQNRTGWGPREDSDWGASARARNQDARGAPWGAHLQNFCSQQGLRHGAGSIEAGSRKGGDPPLPGLWGASSERPTARSAQGWRQRGLESLAHCALTWRPGLGSPEQSTHSIPTPPTRLAQSAPQFLESAP